ncbi:MAG: c-type cytochrome, partial [Planctomycetota bacterium]
MPKRVEENAYIYNYKRLNLIFFISSLTLLGCIILMVYSDYHREWKKYQREFIEQTKKQLEELKTFHKSAIIDEIKKVNEQIEKAKKTLEEKKEEILVIENEIKSNEGKYYLVNQKFEFVKARLNYLRWQIEQNITAGNKQEADKKNRLYQTLLERQNKLYQQLQDLTFEKKQKEQKLLQYKGEVEKLLAEKSKIEKRLKDLDKQLNEFEKNFQNIFRNLPILDFISPTISLDKYQIVLPHIEEDYHFVKTPKVDRCMVCHLGIDKPQFTNAPQPFTTHPKLELFVGESSYHPVNKFGCTVCHSGSGRATTFFDASHTPKNEEQRKEWIKKYNWHENHYWDYPMLPTQYVESSCLKCHNQQAIVPFADKLNKGKMIFTNSGCFGCHKTEGFEHIRETGPTLINISTKLTPRWIEEWLKNPKQWNPHTKMPQPFFLSNTSGEEDKKINNIFIKSITAYLIDNSFPATLSSVPQDIEANIEEGKKLFNLKGCIACHTVGQNYEMDNVRKFGPDLAGIGSKLPGDSGLKWLYNWIKNPHAIFPNTKMPDMRLDDKEAFQIAKYLQSLTNDVRIEGIGDVDTKTVHQLTEYYLMKNYNVNEIKNISEVLNKELLKIKKRVLSDYLEIIKNNLSDGIVKEMKEILNKIQLEELDKGVNEEFDKLKEKYKGFEVYIDNLKKMLIEKIGAIKTTEEEMKKLLYLGYEGILRQGCFGCHQILGFATVPKIAVELTGSNAIGSKDIEKFDFGYLNIPKTRWAWLAEKLKNPRIFDKDKILHYDDKLRMPHFHFNDNEIQHLVTFLLGLTNETINPSIKKNLSYQELIIEKGKEVAINKNCVSCHLFTKDKVILFNPPSNNHIVLEGIIRQYDLNKKIFSFANLSS